MNIFNMAKDICFLLYTNNKKNYRRFKILLPYLQVLHVHSVRRSNAIHFIELNMILVEQETESDLQRFFSW
jgi:hypothetical protein